MAGNLIDLDYLVDALHSLPGIGSKAAKKIAYFLLQKNEQYLTNFIKRIKQAKLNIRLCKRCNNLTDNINQLCSICNDFVHRNTQQLCIVTTVEDLNLIEETQTFNGVYFVLWDELSVKNLTKDIHLEQLINYLKNYPIQEIIFATNFTQSGYLTTSFIYKRVKEQYPKIQFYRIALGLPLNSMLDYADPQTVGFAMKNRMKFEE